jgi:hypothetical protein
MTIYDFLKKSNISFTPFDTRVIGQLALSKAKEAGVKFHKVKEKPWHKQQKRPYMVNDYPESFASDLITIVLEYFGSVYNSK